jgi:cytochrome c553
VRAVLRTLRGRPTACVAAVAVAMAAAVAVAAPSSRKATNPRTLPGWALYDRHCLACHGSAGDGRGPAAPWLWPRPRDFTRGEYKWRSTDVGAAPTRDDLAAAIRWGVAGTSMHGFGGWLDEAAVGQLVDVVAGFGPGPLATSGPRTAACPPPDAARGAAQWQALGCASCHGAGGKGDGPAAASLTDADGRPAAPYDLTAHPVRRPHAPGGDVRAALVDSIASGLAGTAMPGYRTSVAHADLCALADHVDGLRSKAPAAGNAGPLAAAAIRADRADGVASGAWPGHGDPDEARPFGGTIPLQGPPPAPLAPAQASLDAKQCARCHAKQVREWTGSLHAAAGSPGLRAQMVTIGRGGMAADEVESCLRCHAPLAEQQPMLRPGQRGGDDSSGDYQPNPQFSASLQHQGITCAACHVRGWVRHGPPEPSATLLELPSYPKAELALYQRSDFCLPCHQLPPRLAVAGRPLLDTYREWLEGPYMKRGIQCQHCHMPNREHTFRGVHDPATFRQGIAVTARATRSGAKVAVTAAVGNVGAGHFLPTTPTPAAWLVAELVDADGKAIRGARAEKRIGRHIVFDGGWKVREDTRIPPGEQLTLTAAWQRGGVARATGLRVTITVHPDDYYEGFYRARLRRKLTADARRLYQQALARAEAARYVAYDETVPIR